LKSQWYFKPHTIPKLTSEAIQNDEFILSNRCFWFVTENMIPAVVTKSGGVGKTRKTTQITLFKEKY
jgi:hypothetical protein